MNLHVVSLTGADDRVAPAALRALSEQFPVVEWAILQLIKAKTLKMYDKHGQHVKAIKVRRVGKRKNNFVKRSYRNKATGEEVFKEILFSRVIHTEV